MWYRIFHCPGYIFQTNNYIKFIEFGWYRRVERTGHNRESNMAKTGEDCYYFYYSKCIKGSQCPFRHCQAALGSEIVCTNWKKSGQCPKVNCPFRHAIIDKARGTVQCYWENQPGGCKKAHCVFKHSKPRPTITGENASQNIMKNEEKSEDGVSKLNKRVKAALADDSASVGSFSDSEISTKKRKIVSVGADVHDEPSQNESSKISCRQIGQPSPDVSPMVRTEKKKICLRKVKLGAEESAKAKNEAQKQQDQPVRKRRIWRRKSASPKVAVDTANIEATPDTSVSTKSQQSIMVEVSSSVGEMEIDQKKTDVMDTGEAVGKEIRTPQSDTDDEYNQKLRDIFGPDLAEMYISQGIKLDLSQYP